MAAKKTGKRKAKKRKALRKASVRKVGRPRRKGPPMALFNCWLDKPIRVVAEQKAKKYFKGNLSALVRAALLGWKPVRARAA